MFEENVRNLIFFQRFAYHVLSCSENRRTNRLRELCWKYTLLLTFKTTSSSFVGFNCFDLFENFLFHFHQLLTDVCAVWTCVENMYFRFNRVKQQRVEERKAYKLFTNFQTFYSSCSSSYVPRHCSDFVKDFVLYFGQGLRDFVAVLSCVDVCSY